MKTLGSILALPFNVTLTLPALLLFFQSRSSWSPVWIPEPWHWLGFVPMGDGFFLVGWTIYLFATQGKGTLAPWSPPENLVIKGPYRHVRNPMITGVVGILLGEAMVFQSVWLLAWAMFFIILNHLYFILKEEPDLEKKFGQPYKAYKKGVNRWIPRITPYQAG